MGGDLPVKTDSCSAPVSLRKDDVYAPKLEVFGDGFCLGAGDDRLTVGKVCDARNGAFAELCRITQDILFPCVAQNGTLDRGNGEIVAVYDAVVVNGVAAYEGVVHIYIIKEVVRLAADDGARCASYYAAADVGVEYRPVGKILGGLHGVRVYLGRAEVVEQVAQCIDRRAAAQGKRVAAFYQRAGLGGDAALFVDIFMELAVKGLVRHGIYAHYASVGADNELFLLHVRKLLAQS